MGGPERDVWGYITTYRTFQPHVATRWAPFDHPNTSSGSGARTSKAVQTSQNWVNVLILARLIFTPFHIFKIKINHIGFNVGL